MRSAGRKRLGCDIRKLGGVISLTVWLVGLLIGSATPAAATSIPEVSLVYPAEIKVRGEAHLLTEVSNVATTHDWRVRSVGSPSAPGLLIRVPDAPSAAGVLAAELAQIMRVCAPGNISLRLKGSDAQPVRCLELMPGQQLEVVLPPTTYYVRLFLPFLLVLVLYLLIAALITRSFPAKQVERAALGASAGFVAFWMLLHVGLFRGHLQTVGYAHGLGVGLLTLFVLDLLVAQGAFLAVLVSARRRQRSGSRPRVLTLLHLAQHSPTIVGPSTVVLLFIAFPNISLDVLHRFPLALPLIISLLHVVLAFVSPYILSKSLGASEFDDPLWTEKARTAVPMSSWPRLRILQGTGMLNALAIGLIRPQVFVTEELLEHLSTEQRYAVYLHELGHIQRRHTYRMLLWNVLMATGAALAIMFLGEDTSIATVALLAGAAYVISLMGLPFLSRRYELEADVFAAEHAGSENVVSALQAIQQHNGGHRGVSILSLHPTLQQRCNAVQQCR